MQRSGDIPGMVMPFLQRFNWSRDLIGQISYLLISRVEHDLIWNRLALQHDR